MIYAVPSAGLARSTEVQLRFQKEKKERKKKKLEGKDEKKPDYEQSHARHTSILYPIVFREIYWSSRHAWSKDGEQRQQGAKVIDADARSC